VFFLWLGNPLCASPILRAALALLPLTIGKGRYYQHFSKFYTKFLYDFLAAFQQVPVQAQEKPFQCMIASLSYPHIHS